MAAPREFDPEREGIACVPIAADALRSGPFTGLKALMLAVLENGITAYLGLPGRRRDEAEAWVMTRNHRSPFAFAVVCETLGLEPNAVRGTLQEWRLSKRGGRDLRSRGNVRHTERLRPPKGQRSRKRRAFLEEAELDESRE